MKNFLLGSLAIIMFISCNEKETPSIEQSIQFIMHKVDNRDINLNNKTVNNVDLSIINNNVRYKYESHTPEENFHYEVVENFNLNDVSFTGISSFQNIYSITFNLKKNNANRRTFRSLNEKSPYDYGSPPNERIGSAHIHVNEYDIEAVQKAFINIFRKQRENRGEDYFQSK